MLGYLGFSDRKQRGRNTTSKTSVFGDADMMIRESLRLSDRSHNGHCHGRGHGYENGDRDRDRARRKQGQNQQQKEPILKSFGLFYITAGVARGTLTSTASGKEHAPPWPDPGLVPVDFLSCWDLGSPGPGTTALVDAYDAGAVDKITGVDAIDEVDVDAAANADPAARARGTGGVYPPST